MRVSDVDANMVVSCDVLITVMINKDDEIRFSCDRVDDMRVNGIDDDIRVNYDGDSGVTIGR